MKLIELLIELEDQEKALKKRIQRKRREQNAWMQKPWQKVGDARRLAKNSVRCECTADNLERDLFSLRLRISQLERHLKRLIHPTAG